MSDFNWWASWMLYTLGIFVAFALITSRIKDKIHWYQERNGEDEFPPESMFWMLSLVWPVIIFGLLPALFIRGVVRFFYRIGMGEVDFKRPVRSMRGGFGRFAPE